MTYKSGFRRYLDVAEIAKVLARIVSWQLRRLRYHQSVSQPFGKYNRVRPSATGPA